MNNWNISKNNSVSVKSNLVEVKNLVKEFKPRGLIGNIKAGVRAIDNVSFSIEKNTVFGLVGESGCGKTTVARTLLLLETPTSGEILFRGTSLTKLSKRELKNYRRNMQIVFQDPNSSLNPKLKIATSMAEGLSNIGITGTKREEIIDKHLELVGISPKSKTKYPHEFSGGQKQRIVIARALTLNPEFLILDEPVSNLDVSIQAQIINLLLDLKEKFKLTYLFISHDLNLVAYLSDKIAVMYKGKIVEIGNVENIINNPVHPYTIKLLNSIPGNPKKHPIPNNNPVEEGTLTKESSGCPYYNQCPIRESRCRDNIPELKQVNDEHAVACFIIEKQV